MEYPSVPLDEMRECSERFLRLMQQRRSVRAFSHPYACAGGVLGGDAEAAPERTPVHSLPHRLPGGYPAATRPPVPRGPDIERKGLGETLQWNRGGGADSS